MINIDGAVADVAFRLFRGMTELAVAAGEDPVLEQLDVGIAEDGVHVIFWAWLDRDREVFASFPCADEREAARIDLEHLKKRVARLLCAPATRH